MLTSEYLSLPLEAVHVERAERQRRSLDVTDIKDSIRIRGVIQPIIVERQTDNMEVYILVAGERRLTASRELGLTHIPARLASTLTSAEHQIIELEENIKRKDLDWKDEAAAIARIHQIYLTDNPQWTQSSTAEQIGLQPGMISIYMQVAEALAEGNKSVALAGGVRAAYNIIARKTSRAMDDALNELLSPSGIASPPPLPPSSDGQHIPTPPAPVREISTEFILPVSFLQFAPAYSGPTFNFIHCDFPYGINLDKSDQGNSDQWGGYADTPETYWSLCQCLADNLDRLMSPSAHLMFWFSMEFYHETLTFFQNAAPSLTFQTFPLVWHKTDNRGILPDPERGPRRVYETAFLASRGDRKIIRAVSNAYGSPTTKEIHQSEKSEPMLRHFFQMFIDQNSRVLDPTAGSGSALRAAESLGAQATLGLEIDPDFCNAANIALRKARILRGA